MNRIYHGTKDWQLFVLTTGLLIICLLFGVGFTFGEIDGTVNMSRTDQMFFNIIIEILQFFVDLVLFGWFWSIGMGLKKYLGKHHGLNHGLFILFLLLSLAYSIYDFIGAIYFEYFWSEFKDGNGSRSMMEYILHFSNLNPYVLLLTLFATFCNFFVFYFCGKTLRTLEKGRTTDFSENIGSFFAFWFHFIGVWIIQPKVNLITSGNWTPPPSSYLPEDEITPVISEIPIPPREIYPHGEKLNTKNHEAFNHDDDFDGLI